MAAVRHDGKLSEWFRTSVGVRQGCTLSPDLFNLVLEMIMRMALDNETVGLRLCGRLVSNLRFADDINLMATSPDELQAVTDHVNQQSARLGLVINIDKTKTMAVGDEQMKLHIQINGKELEQVKEFVYLGGVISDDGRSIADIRRRIGLTYAAFNKLGNVWNCRSLSTTTKKKVFEALIAPILLYGSECWTMRKEDEKRISVAEMNWLRKIKGVSRLQHIRNEEIRRQLGMMETMVERVKKRRLQWFGHVSRMNNERLPYLALHTQLEGTRSRGRQRTRWRDNVRNDIEERNMEFREALSLLKDRDKWMEFVRPHRRYNS
jgi:Reverse transcriptase (RNA-dependent DNA polymerase)